MSVVAPAVEAEPEVEEAEEGEVAEGAEAPAAEEAGEGEDRSEAQRLRLLQLEAGDDGRRAREDGGPWIVLGLGNLDDEYGNTRYNAGAMVVARLADRAGAALEVGPATAPRWPRSARATPGSSWPDRTATSTRSGVGLRCWPGSKTPVERIIVVHDEIDLASGKLQLRQHGGTAGHNGLKDIAKALGSPDFLRSASAGRPQAARTRPTSSWSRSPSAMPRTSPSCSERIADATMDLVRLPRRCPGPTQRLTGTTEREGAKVNSSSGAVRSGADRRAAHRTPVRTSASIGRTGAQVLVKDEAVQKTGSFKARGALNRLLTLPDDARSTGHRRQPRGRRSPGRRPGRGQSHRGHADLQPGHQGGRLPLRRRGGAARRPPPGRPSPSASGSRPSAASPSSTRSTTPRSSPARHRRPGADGGRRAGRRFVVSVGGGGLTAAPWPCAMPTPAAGWSRSVSRARPP